MLDLLAADYPELFLLADRLDAGGVRAYLVGGPVRDLLAGRVPKDLDITSPATPAAFRALVADLDGVGVYDVGERYGTTGVVFDRCDRPALVVEHTTHRAEAYTGDSRQPTVTFGTDLVADLARRDFTVNAMAVDLVDGTLYDPFGGRADLAAAVLRTPAEANRTFSEDPLRIVRLVRFAAARGFAPHPDTAAAARSCADRLGIVPVERVVAELRRIFDGGGAALAAAVALCAELGLLDEVFVGLGAGRLAGCDLTGLADRTDCLAALYAVTGGAETVLRAATFSNAEIAAAAAVSGAVDALGTATAPAEVRAVLRRFGNDAAGRALRVAAAIGRPVAAGIAAAVLGEAADFATRRLPVDGNDALAAGLSGRRIGDALRRVEAALCADPTLGRDAALAILAAAAHAPTAA